MNNSTTADKPANAVSKLAIDYGSSTNPGLRFTYTGKPSLFSFSELLMLLVVIIFVGVSLAIVFGNEPYRWEGLILLPVGIVFLGRYWVMRKNPGRLVTLRYSVKVDNGKAYFTDDFGQNILDLDKLGRLWIATERTNGTLTAADIIAYYNGGIMPVLNIMEHYPRLGGQEHVVLKHIVDYLNSFAAEFNKHQ